MLIGIPAEIKDREHRVAMTPAGVAELVGDGHRVLVEQNAGHGSGFSDAAYSHAGATIVAAAADVWAAEMVLKVKEPQAGEYAYLRPDLTLFTYLHLAADVALTDALCAAGTLAIAYETVEERDGSLPLLTPMSDIAGRMATQVGAHYLEASHGGRGILLGGVPGVRPAHVVVIGGGIVGTAAARIALGMGAHVTVFDVDRNRMAYLNEVLHGHLTTLSSNQHAIAEATATADLLIGAVLVKGARAPKLVSEAMIATMRPGSVVVDVAIDQGGCIATARPTSHSAPTYTVHDVLHYCVTNMPGAVPITSTHALSNATLPYVRRLAHATPLAAVRDSAPLAQGVNVYQGHLTYASVAEAFEREYVPLTSLL